jgi:hypothetical protein
MDNAAQVIARLHPKMNATKLKIEILLFLVGWSRTYGELGSLLAKDL